MESSEGTSTSSTISTAALENFVEKLRNERNRSSTRKMYYSVWKKFNQFFIHLDIKPENWEDRLVLFVGYLVETQKKSTMIKSYISAIKGVLRDDNIIINEDRYLLKLLTKACKYKNDKVRIRLPIQKGILQLLLDKISDCYRDSQTYRE